MRSLMILTIGFALTVMVAPASGQGTPADEAAIRKAADQFPPAWAKGDAKSLAALYTTDADYVSSTGLMARGRAEIEKAYVTQFSGVYKGTILKNATTNVRFLKTDIAITNGTFEVTGLRGPDGKEASPRKGISTSIVVKQNGQWLITALRAWVPPSPSAQSSR
jgi:uncharacterized protein (TIGR02246 family)